MLITYILILLSSNAVTLRRDKSILYSRVVTLFLNLIESDSKIKNNLEIFISTFISSSYYKVIQITYHKKGVFALLQELALFTYYTTLAYIEHNLYYILAFQCVCIYSASSGNNLFLIISLFHLIIHLPFFILSILAHITVVNRNFYREHPLLFAISICACFLLFVLFIFLVIKLSGIIYHLIDYYLKTKSNNGENTGGNNPGYEADSGPGSTPPGGGNPGPFDPINSTSEQDRINRKKDEQREYNKIYWDKNKDSTNEKNRNRTREEKDHVNVNNRKYRDENKDTLNENRRKKTLSRVEKDKVNERSKRYRDKNKDSINEKNRNKTKSRVEKDRDNERSRKSIAKKKD